MCIQYGFQTGLERAIEHEEILLKVPFKMFVGFYSMFTDIILESKESLCYAS